MKSLLKGVMILLIGMISLSGYSSTTTSTPEKKDVIEKLILVPTIVGVQVIKTQSTSVENLTVYRTSENLYNITKETTAAGNIPEMQTLKTVPNPPPLVQLE